MNKVMHKLDCPQCRQNFGFQLNIEIDGYYHIVCPMCGHTHKRVVVDGKFSVPSYHPHMTDYLPTVIYGIMV